MKVAGSRRGMVASSNRGKGGITIGGYEGGVRFVVVGCCLLLLSMSLLLVVLLMLLLLLLLLLL